MKKLLIAGAFFTSLFAYSQSMMDLLIMNNSPYIYKGKIAAGDFTGTNCGLTITSVTPSTIAIDPGLDSRYEDFKGQHDMAASPVDQWEVNDGVNPPQILDFDHPDLSYIYPDITRWAFSEFDMIDPVTSTNVFSGQIQSPNYTCISGPSTINTPSINADWSYITDPNTGDTLALIMIN